VICGQNCWYSLPTTPPLPILSIKSHLDRRSSPDVGPYKPKGKTLFTWWKVKGSFKLKREPDVHSPHLFPFWSAFVICVGCPVPHFQYNFSCQFFWLFLYPCAHIIHHVPRLLNVVKLPLLVTIAHVRPNLNLYYPTREGRQKCRMHRLSYPLSLYTRHTLSYVGIYKLSSLFICSQYWDCGDQSSATPGCWPPKGK